MKNTQLITKIAGFVLLVFLFVQAPDAYAQKSRSKKEKAPKEKKERKSRSRDSGSNDEKLSREEERALKSEVKAYQKNLPSFKKFKEDKARAESDLASNSRELIRVKELEAQCANEVEELRKQIEDLERRLREKNAQPAITEGFGIPKQGLYYVVQIGAFQQKDVSVNNDNPDFRKENADGFNKYIMGVFNSIEQADQLRNFLLQLDFRTPAYRPFVAPYRDGMRISIDEALGADEAAKRKSKGQ